ncbi:MAG TPA: hypothetical protein VN155_17070 [Devosia sp.]|nr:hypothetical protein [Devosia sp.]
MKDLTTPIPPVLRRANGELEVEIIFHIDGESYSVSAPIGDGRYHVQRVFDLIIGPAIAPHPTDAVMSEREGPLNEF